MHTRKKGSNMHPWVSALFGNLKVIYTHKGACSWISHLLCQSINTWVKKKRAFNIHPHKLGADLNLYFLACTPQTSGLKIKHRRRGVNGVLNSATFNFRGGKGNSSSSASARFIGELFVEIVVRMSCKVILWMEYLILHCLMYKCYFLLYIKVLQKQTAENCLSKNSEPMW